MTEKKQDDLTKERLLNKAEALFACYPVRIRSLPHWLRQRPALPLPLLPRHWLTLCHARKYADSGWCAF